MDVSTATAIRIIITIAVGFIVSFAATPIVKLFAQKVGAMDIPNEERRIHDHPIPRMGGLAIFLGFIISTLLFSDITLEVRGILLGCVVIVATGAVDDLVSLNAWVKFSLQIVAAIVAVAHNVRIEIVINPAFWSEAEHLILGSWSIPVTIIWIVAITNSVNLIDGLDGLAVGVSTISSVTMLIVSLLVSDVNIAIILAALVGACVGFMPYNLNPAKIFMGDTGALLLGYVLATISVLGLFKFYALVSFAVPLLALAIPLLDTILAFVRRLLKGQNPFHADRQHLHHKLIDLGLNQKQAVAILYTVSGILGLSAVILTTDGTWRILISIVAFCLCAFLWWYIYNGMHQNKIKLLKIKRAKSSDDNESVDIPATNKENDNEKD